jgi:predicted transcriptional regulator
MTEIAKTVGRIRAFFRARPHLNMSDFAKRSSLHRNTFYGMDDAGWNPRIETVDKILRAIDEYEDEEAAQGKSRRPKSPVLALA